VANKDFNDMISKNSNGAKTGVRGPKSDTVNESTVNWPGNPGKSGPDRSAGVEKVKTSAKSDGI
jgi:hypothetical protein